MMESKITKLVNLLGAVLKGVCSQNVKGHIVDVLTHEIFDGEIIIKGGKIKRVRRCKLDENKKWSYLLPGFIFVTMAFMCLSVIPEIKITDKCILDTSTMTPLLSKADKKD